MMRSFGGLLLHRFCPPKAPQRHFVIAAGGRPRWNHDTWGANPGKDDAAFIASSDSLLCCHQRCNIERRLDARLGLRPGLEQVHRELLQHLHVCYETL